MSAALRDKKVRRVLVRFLKALSRAGALLVRDMSPDGQEGGFLICTKSCDRTASLFRPPDFLVKQALREDLLVKAEGGWRLSDNGRLALRRLLAGADPYAEQHQHRTRQRRKTGGEECDVIVNDCSSPLGWLARRKDADGRPLISPTLFAAGERLARDFHFAGMMPRTTSSWSRLNDVGGRRCHRDTLLDLSDNRLAARQRVRRAIDDVGGELAGILLDICCLQIGLSQVEKTRKWPRRSGKVILQIALERLADHYGMSPHQQTGNKSSGITHWGDEGYKPS